MLTAFNQQLLKKESLRDVLESISEWHKKLIHTEHCSLFTYNKEEHRQLLTQMAAVIVKNITYPHTKG